MQTGVFQFPRGGLSSRSLSSVFESEVQGNQELQMFHK